MSDDGIPSRLAALDTAWEWVSDAPSRLDAVVTSFSSLQSRLDAMDDTDVINKLLTLIQSNEASLEELAQKLPEAKRTQDDRRSSYEKSAEELTRRVETTKSQVG